jgi:hypothetical protein
MLIASYLLFFHDDDGQTLARQLLGVFFGLAAV